MSRVRWWSAAEHVAPMPRIMALVALGRACAPGAATPARRGARRGARAGESHADRCSGWGRCEAAARRGGVARRTIARGARRGQPGGVGARDPASARRGTPGELAFWRRRAGDRVPAAPVDGAAVRAAARRRLAAGRGGLAAASAARTRQARALADGRRAGRGYAAARGFDRLGARPAICERLRAAAARRGRAAHTRAGRGRARVTTPSASPRARRRSWRLLARRA